MVYIQRVDEVVTINSVTVRTDNGVCYFKSIVNEDGTFVTVDCFREKCDINTNYITCIVQAVKSYTCKTGLTVEKNKSIHLTKILKVIYNA